VGADTPVKAVREQPGLERTSAEPPIRSVRGGQLISPCELPIRMLGGLIGRVQTLKVLFTRLAAAKITQIKLSTPAAWAKAEAKAQVVAQAA
jgi:hypothetical protein